MKRRIALCTLALCLPLRHTPAQEGKSVGSARADALLMRVRAAARTLALAQKAGDTMRFQESGDAWARIATEFDDTRLLPDFAVRDAAFFAGEAYARASRPDDAFMYLEKALTSWPWHNNLESRPTLLALQSDPRWKPFLARWNRAQSRDLTPAEKVYGLTRFWQEARDSFAYFDRVPDLDWDAAYREYVPKVLAAKGRLEYVLVLRRFCALLHDGHTNIYTPNDLNPWGALPINLVAFGDRIFVGDVLKSEGERIPIGTEILRVAGRPAADYVREELQPLISSSTKHILWRDAVQRLSAGKRATKIRLAFRTPQGKTSERELTFDPKNFEGAMLRGTPPAPSFARKDLGEGIVLLTLGSFGSDEAADAFEKALPELQKSCKGLVIDIRRNGGGNSGVGWRIARHLTDHPLVTSAWRTRESRAAYRAWGMFARVNETLGTGDEERVRHFLGEQWYTEPGEAIPPVPASERLNVPVVVLTDYDTASAAEDFLIALDGAKNVTRVGRKSFGSTGQPIPLLLPGNIQARVCTKRDTYPDGRDFVGVGVIPHVEVEPAPQDYFAGKDVILERGLAVLKERMTKQG